MAGVDLAFDVPRDVADAADVGDGRPAEFHHDARHGNGMPRPNVLGSTAWKWLKNAARGRGANARPPYPNRLASARLAEVSNLAQWRYSAERLLMLSDKTSNKIK